MRAFRRGHAGLILQGSCIIASMLYRFLWQKQFADVLVQCMSSLAVSRWILNNHNSVVHSNWIGRCLRTFVSLFKIERRGLGCGSILIVSCWALVWLAAGSHLHAWIKSCATHALVLLNRHLPLAQTCSGTPIKTPDLKEFACAFRFLGGFRNGSRVKLLQLDTLLNLNQVWNLELFLRFVFDICGQKVVENGHSSIKRGFRATLLFLGRFPFVFSVVFVEVAGIFCHLRWFLMRDHCCGCLHSGSTWIITIIRDELTRPLSKAIRFWIEFALKQLARAAALSSFESPLRLLVACRWKSLTWPALPLGVLNCVLSDCSPSRTQHHLSPLASQVCILCQLLCPCLFRSSSSETQMGFQHGVSSKDCFSCWTHSKYFNSACLTKG